MISWLVVSGVSEEHTDSIFSIEFIGVKMLLSNIDTDSIFIPPTSILKMEEPCSTETLIRSRPGNTWHHAVQTVLSAVQNCQLVLQGAVTNLYSQKGRKSLARYGTGSFSGHTLLYGVSFLCASKPRLRGV
jgi:hypothetical protein